MASSSNILSQCRPLSGPFRVRLSGSLRMAEDETPYSMRVFRIFFIPPNSNSLTKEEGHRASKVLVRPDMHLRQASSTVPIIDAPVECQEEDLPLKPFSHKSSSLPF